MRAFALITAICSGCARAFRPQVGPIWMQGLLQGAPKGPHKFQLGWKDGCHTGIGATGNHHQKLFYGFKQDYKLALDHEYYTGWKIGWNFCQRYVYQYLFVKIL